jgi:hypothetical protein
MAHDSPPPLPKRDRRAAYYVLPPGVRAALADDSPFLYRPTREHRCDTPPTRQPATSPPEKPPAS